MPKTIAKVAELKPKFLPLKDCYKYTGMEAKLFRQLTRSANVPVYAWGRKKILHKVEDLDRMMEGLKIIDRNKKAVATNNS